MVRFKEVVNAVFDAILPRRERRIRTEARMLDDIPLAPVVHDLLRVRITTIMDYRQKAVEDLIRSIKYDGSSHAVRLAAGLLADYLREEIASEKSFSTKRLLIVPVPLFHSRARERGWNQVELILKALPAEFHDGTLAALAPRALARIRETKPQTRLHRSERLSNVAGAFECPNPALVEKTQIFLIDDVTTTGATLANAATPLRRAGAKVTLIALARA